MDSRFRGNDDGWEQRIRTPMQAAKRIDDSAKRIDDAGKDPVYFA